MALHCSNYFKNLIILLGIYTLCDSLRLTPQEPHEVPAIKTARALKEVKGAAGMICTLPDGTVINADGNYQNPSDCNSFYACGGGVLYETNCGADTLFYVAIPDICGYADSNQNCPNYWLTAQNDMQEDGCPQQGRWEGSAPLRVPTLAKDSCLTYRTCFSRSLNIPPVDAACPDGYFFSITNMACIDNSLKTKDNCNE